MGRPLELKSLGLSKEMKAIGATAAVKKGNQIELTIDPSRLNADKRKSLGAGLMKASASANVMTNDPMDSTFFDGPFSAGSVLETHQKIKLAMRYFKSEPLVGKIIETMAVFCNDGFKNEHANPKIKKFYDDWCYKVNMDLVLNWIFLEYFRSGNVVTYRELAPYNKPDISAPDYNSSNSAVNGKTSSIIMPKMKKVMMPAAYTILNPLHVFVKSNNAFMDVLYFDLQKVMSTQVDTSDEMDNITLSINRLPGNLKIKHQGAKKIPLDKKNVKRILRMRQPYEPYGTVIMERAFAPVHEKNKMRMMDMTMVNSVVNQIIKVTIGNDQYPASAKQLQRLAQAFQNSGKSQTIFWNHTLNIEVIRPDTKVLNNEKYARVNEDIRNAFGISEVLTGGGGAKLNFATAFLSLKVFLTNLRLARADTLRWVRSEYEDIAEQMGFDSIPDASFNELELTDEVAEKQIIMGLIDRGVISYETAQTRMGYDSGLELKRKLAEQHLVEEGVLGVLSAGSPYQQEAQGTPKSNDETVKADNSQNSKAGNPSKQSPDSGKKKSTTGGRPKGGSGNYPEKRKQTAVKGASASIIETKLEGENNE